MYRPRERDHGSVVHRPSKKNLQGRRKTIGRMACILRSVSLSPFSAIIYLDNLLEGKLEQIVASPKGLRETENLDIECVNVMLDMLGC